MVVNVLVELSNKNIDKTFDYLVPSHLEDKIQIGMCNGLHIQTYASVNFQIQIDSILLLPMFLL